MITFIYLSKTHVNLSYFIDIFNNSVSTRFTGSRVQTRARSERLRPFRPGSKCQSRLRRERLRFPARGASYRDQGFHGVRQMRGSNPHSSVGRPLLSQSATPPLSGRVSPYSFTCQVSRMAHPLALYKLYTGHLRKYAALSASTCSSLASISSQISLCASLGFDW